MKLFVFVFVSVATLFGAGAPAGAQDSAYPPRLIVVTVSDSSVDAGATYTVSLDGCNVGQVVDFTIEGSSRQAGCVLPATEMSALVLRSVPGRAEAELTAPNRAGQYVGNVRFGSGDGTIVLDFDLEVVAAPAFIATAASGTPAGSASVFSTVTWMILAFILGLGLASGFWFVAQRRD